MTIISSNNLLGFPLDSMQIGYHDDGFPKYSNEYTSDDYRAVLNKLISSGVIADNDSQSLKPLIVSGQTSKTATVRISAGASVIKGGFAINKSDMDYNIAAPEIQGNETSRTKTTYIYIQRFTSHSSNDVEETYSFVKEESTASGNSILGTPPSKVYALCLARVVSRTTKSGTSYNYQHTVTDLRASEYCGWAAPFVDVDTSAYYDAVQQVVNESKAEVEAAIPKLLENAQDSVDSAIANLEQHSQAAIDSTQGAIDDAIAELQQQTQNAVDLAQGALDETLAGDLDGRLDAIEDGAPAYLEFGKEITEGFLANFKEPGTYFVKPENVSKIKDKPNVDMPHGFKLYVLDYGTYSSEKLVLNILISGTTIVSRYVRYNSDGSGRTLGLWVFYVSKSGLNDAYVDTGSVIDSAITTPKLADGAVTEDKLADVVKYSVSQENLPIASVFEAASGFSLYFDGGQVIRNGNVIFLNVAVIPVADHAAGEHVEIAAVKNGYRPKCSAFVGTNDCKGIIEPNGKVIVLSDSVMKAGVRQWIRGCMLI